MPTILSTMSDKERQSLLKETKPTVAVQHDSGVSVSTSHAVAFRPSAFEMFCFLCLGFSTFMPLFAIISSLSIFDTYVVSFTSDTFLGLDMLYPSSGFPSTVALRNIYPNLVPTCVILLIFPIVQFPGHLYSVRCPLSFSIGVLVANVVLAFFPRLDPPRTLYISYVALTLISAIYLVLPLVASSTVWGFYIALGFSFIQFWFLTASLGTGLALAAVVAPRLPGVSGGVKNEGN